MKKIAILLFAPMFVLAGQNMPSDDDIMKSAAAAVKKVNELPSNAELIQQGAQFVGKNLPKIDTAAPAKVGVAPITDIPSFMTDRGMDPTTLDALGKGLPDAAAAFHEEKNLLVMVSFSMPDSVLKSYADQASDAGATLVLRGLYEESMAKTADKIKSLGIHTTWEVDPPLFRKFQVKHVPVTLLVNAEAAAKMENDCAPDVSYLRVDGDVSIRQALQIMRLKGSGELSQLAGKKLSDIEGAR